MDRKFEEIYNVDDYEILTDDGWKDIRAVCKTIPYDVWELKLVDNKNIKCADDHIVFSDSKEKFVKDLVVGDIIDTAEGISYVSECKNLMYQENMYDVQVDGQKYYSNGILSHNTTIVAAYVLWYAIFHKDKTIGIVSNKERSAKMILDRIRKSYEALPTWLKPGVTEYSKTFITFDNGSKIIIAATSADAFRGESLNLLCMDEFAFVQQSQAEDFWSANYPTISASKKAKIVIISTPNGLFNLFHKIWVDADLKKNSFVTTKVSWGRVPGRDQEWADEQRKNIGERQFAQEFAVEFIGSTNTLINPTTLEIILKSDLEPKFTDLDNRLKIWEKPKERSQYVLGVDPAKGTGENYSVIQVLKIDSLKPIKLEQVAVFRHNLTDVYDFTDVLQRIAIYYNKAYVMCENNGEGSSVVNRLWWEHEYDGLVNSGSKTKNLGIRSTGGVKGGTKSKACLLLKKLIEDGSLKMFDLRTLMELGSFIEEDGRFFGQSMNDDCVMALAWAVYFFDMNILSEKYEFDKSDNDSEGWGVLTDVDLNDTDDWTWLDENFKA